jgi:hypothetical protein
VAAFGARLYLVPSQGGQRTLLAEPDSTRGHLALSFPDLLPGGKAAVLAIGKSAGSVSEFLGSTTIGVVSIPDGNVTDLGIPGMFPKYSPTGSTSGGLTSAPPRGAESQPTRAAAGRRGATTASA